MVIHIGEIVKSELNQQNISVIDFAKKMDISISVIHDILGRESIDTGLLNKMCIALNCNFFSLYAAQEELASDPIEQLRSLELNLNDYSVRLSATLKQNELLKLEVTFLKKIIAVMQAKQKRRVK
jgi:transcriptional regulator with XRE-family HTH domain